MEGPRPPRENEYPQILNFLDSELRPEKKWSLASEYPTAFSLSNMHNIRVITDNNRLLSHAVIKPLIVRTPLAIYKVAAVGSVFTHPEHRNMGLSHKVLEECLHEATKQECDMAILWSDLYEFYRKMNFELAGSEISFVLENEFAAPMTGLKIIKGTQISVDAVTRLYNQHSVNSVRTTEETRKFFQIPNSSVFTAWNNSNQLVAYAIEGKGADLTGYIHEWGGSTPAILSLLSHIRKETGKAVTIILPAHAQNMIRHLDKIEGATKNHGYLGMIKILNHEQLFKKIKKAARSIGLNDFVLEKNSQGYVLGVASELLIISDEKDLTRVLFGPRVDLPDITPEIQAQFDKILPLPLWIWGWDSI